MQMQTNIWHTQHTKKQRKNIMEYTFTRNLVLDPLKFKQLLQR